MKLNLSNEHDKNKFLTYANKLIVQKANVELKEVKNKRTVKQNAALHLFFTFISDELNELGMEFNYTGLKGYDISTTYTPNIVKEFLWRPIQIAMFDIESTTDLKTKEMDQIIEVILKFFAEKGVEIFFPSIDALL